jgi:amino acid adenylation domain-containing protein
MNLNYRIDNLSQISTVVDLLRIRAGLQPHQRAFTFLTDGEMEGAALTYVELDQHARSIAASIQQKCKPGDRVLLLYPQGLEYIGAFFGCLYAGVIAVPAYPPRRKRASMRLQAIFADCQPSLVMTSAAIAQVLQQTGDLIQIPWLIAEEIAQGREDEWREPVLTEASLAFIQYTSGSSGLPKGVMLSHGNLIHNERMIQVGFQQTQQSIVVGWLPMYHDMGLIGNVLQPIYSGCACILMSPVHFLQRPLRWLQAISRYKGTTSGGPNFAYDLCVRKITPEQKAGLDLSAWTVAFNGAEPIRAGTLERFATYFKSCGFCFEAFRPCYGLAEATLLVTVAHGPRWLDPAQNKNDEGDRRSLVSAGQKILDQRILVVEPESATECVTGDIGEIWISSPSVAQGYWNHTEETERLFRAYLNTGDGPFLRTEDLGLIVGGELFITGRLKDLIIIRGRNHYPQDIEQTVEESHPALRPGCGAAFSVEIGDEERLVIVQELDRNRDSDANAAIEAIRFAVAQRHELQVYAVVLISAGSLPKTTSGKVQRKACRSLFIEGRLDVRARSVQGTQDGTSTTNGVIAASSNMQSMRASLLSLVAGLTGINSTEIDVNQPLTNYCLDSLTALQLQNEFEIRTGRRLPLNTLFSGLSITDLAGELFRASAVKNLVAIAPHVNGEAPEEYGLSYGQKAIWFLHHLDTESPAYNIARAICIFDDVDMGALNRSVQSLLNRHPVLRTTFRVAGDQVFQQIRQNVEGCFNYESADTWNEEELQQRLATESERPFNLQQGPLLRVFVFKQATHQYLLLFVIHHIVADLWSLALLFDELWEIYDGEVRSEVLKTSSSATPFSTYVSWQERLLLGPDGARLKHAWANQLAGKLPVTKLPGTGSRATQHARHSAYEFDLDQITAESLRELAQSESTTLYIVLLAAFFNLVRRYTGQSDMVVGAMASGRTRAEFAQTVGLFTNALGIRGRPDSQQSFTSWVRRMARTVTEALEHQEYPFARLVEDLEPVREPGSSPLFQMVFSYQKSPKHKHQALSSMFLGTTGPRVTFNGMSVQPIGLPVRQAPFDLIVSMADDETGLKGVIEFRTDLFDAAMIERFGQHFKTMLKGIAANPSGSLADLPLLTADEIQQFEAWNATERSHIVRQRIPDLFEAQVRTVPEKTALIVGSEQLSYKELNARANQLAHYLQSLGVGPETLVGVFMDRSIDLIVTMLAILKAGGAYLPFDLNYPTKRLALMSEDAQLSIAVTRTDLGLQLPSTIERVVFLDASRGIVDQQSTENPSSDAIDGNMAYVIYTSGSTGRPHGIAIEHRNCVAMLCWFKKFYAADDFECVLAAASTCFDMSIMEMFGPLSWGGSLVLVENGMHLIDLPPSVNITYVVAVPSVVEQVLRFSTLPSSIRSLNFGGEPLSRKLCDKIFSGGGNPEQLYNLYGPAEYTTLSTFGIVEKHDVQSPRIGKPIDNTKVYIVDPEMNRVPIGAVGEILVAGEGLARGYINSPELTAERFISNPFSDVAGARLYKTGDLARFREDGNIEYIGRRDFQVKLRGFRIELGEIESALLAHPDVAEALVVDRVDRTGERCLVAYVVPNGTQQLKVTDVRRQLQGKLPAYLVPSFFVVLAEFPRLLNGKIDRAALPAPDADAASLEANVQPRTKLEGVVATVWQEVLQCKEIGVEQNFFELGGTSFKALEVLRRLEQIYHRRILVNELFKYPTVSSLAGFLAGHDTGSNSIQQIRHRAETQRRALDRIARATQPR